MKPSETHLRVGGKGKIYLSWNSKTLETTCKDLLTPIHNVLFTKLSFRATLANTAQCRPMLAWQTRRNGNLDWRLSPTSVRLVSLVVALYDLTAPGQSCDSIRCDCALLHCGSVNTTTMTSGGTTQAR